MPTRSASTISGARTARQGWGGGAPGTSPYPPPDPTPPRAEPPHRAQVGVARTLSLTPPWSGPRAHRKGLLGHGEERGSPPSPPSPPYTHTHTHAGTPVSLRPRLPGPAAWEGICDPPPRGEEGREPFADSDRAVPSHPPVCPSRACRGREGWVRLRFAGRRGVKIEPGRQDAQARETGELSTREGGGSKSSLCCIRPGHRRWEARAMHEVTTCGRLPY